MKKIITIAALLITSISICSAQDQLESDEFHIGAKIGLNSANVYDSKGEEFQADPKIGMALGAFLSIPINSIVGIQPEILFSQKGFQATGRILGFNYDFKRTTSYLDIPVYFAIKPSNFITILAGPQFCYLLSKKDVFTSSTNSYEQEKEFDNENYRKNTLGASLGVDVNINHLVLGVRANWDLQENNGDGTSTTPRYKNQWIQATVGFRF